MRTLAQEIGKFENSDVELFGWVAARRDHGKIIFIDLRDRSGIVQLVFTPANKILYGQADILRPEWVIKITGKIQARPKGMENPELLTGEFEVAVEALEILARAETPSIAIDTDGYEIGEEARMEHRFLDLRRRRLQKNLRLRHKVLNFCREFLGSRDFVEIETPILGKSTPEGARDYLVPSRLYPGKFYALPQSPQQYKQLLMVAGFERYFQVARCFRDEDTRGDRQPEFTQIDLEMSFVSAEEIMSLAEELFTKLTASHFPDHHITFKPFPRLRFAEVMQKHSSDKPDLRDNKSDPGELAFAFVVDFPMFEWRESEKRWDTVHHPFTKPQVENKEEFIKQFKKDPAKILAFQYDLVLNGYEVGGGSLRIHDPELLSAVFEALGHAPREIEERFGHMLKAFKMGAPPHGGIAIGFDRLMAILTGEPNIREVIAFPKTGDGRDLMMGAPAEVDKKQLQELQIQIKKSKTQ